LGGPSDGDWLANLDYSFGLAHRLVFADAAWLFLKRIAEGLD
jgi:uncharacterized membrane protein